MIFTEKFVIMNSIKFTVIGAGSWGTTLAKVLCENYPDQQIFIWDINKDNLNSIKSNRENPVYLPGIKLPENLYPVESLEEAVEVAGLILLVVPSGNIREVVDRIKSSLKFKKVKAIVSAVKGLEPKTRLRMSRVIIDVLGKQFEDKIFALSGPSHAEEVSRKIPTAVVAAGNNLTSIKNIQKIFSNEYFRVYASLDITGVEIGGSIKNVIAIAAGILDGLDLGDNSKAALVTRGMKEIQRLGLAMGAKKETFSGLSGIGDLIVTCFSGHSRNRFVGEKLGKGETLQEILKSMVQVSEGVGTTKAVRKLSRDLEVEMPISNQVYRILFNNKDPKTAVTQLMTRKLKLELE